MYTIISKDRLNALVSMIKVKAPRVAKNAKAGQFVMVMPQEKGERIPLTIYNHNSEEGSITIIFQEAGKTTKTLASFKAGDNIANITGPLGRPTAIKEASKIIFVGGGVGIAELVPVVKHAKSLGSEIVVIIGARTKELLILKDELADLSKNLIITTDDGTDGEKGFVTTALEKAIKNEKFDLCYCVGPDIMMKSVCAVTKKYSLKTTVSLDANMVDATGMCGTCRVMAGGETKFACVDGPEFDGHNIDFDEFMARQKRFQSQEQEALEHFNKRCKCKNSEETRT